MSLRCTCRVLAAMSLVIGGGLAPAAEGTSRHLRSFGWFADLVGSCWTGEYPDGRTSDTQCYSSQYGRMLRGTIRLEGMHNGQAVANFEGDSVYAWNAKAKRIDYTFWANDGTYGTAKAYLEGDTIVHVSDRPADSKAPELRSVWRRVDADTFEVTREKKNGDAWERDFAVTYHRKGIASVAAPCDDVPRMQALDFWMGRWSVHAQGEHVGDNLIERILGDCAVTERWTDARGRQGFSLFYYDATQDLWKQVWVTDDALRTGGLKEKVEQKELTAPGRMRFQGYYAAPSGATILDRTTLTSNADGTLHQLIEISTDAGKSWRTTFDSVHRRL